MSMRSVLASASKMVQKHHVEGYENFKNFVANFKGNGKPIHILYSSKKNEDGTNWCPYCENGMCIFRFEVMYFCYSVKLIGVLFFFIAFHKSTTYCYCV